MKGRGSLQIALTAVMTAATWAMTFFIAIPFAPTRGFFNLGDAMVMLSGLLFGASVGGFAGGVGSALADLTLGYAHFAPLTLFIKGLEGYLTGLIGYQRPFPYRVAAVAVGSAAMLGGYFAVEVPLYGLGAAIGEAIFVNSVQVLWGSVVSLAVASSVLKAYPQIAVFPATERTAKAGLLAVIVAAMALMAIVVAYLLLAL